ncbi:unnamed protein product [Dibothriocephalus latus]|uniref:Uncharacterized protein n=1 Tax=Dibothriocephalus latus TaxID=60516 RepID=A0A3P7LNT3_DIBLA|nr:unnamed protein product [Dibothriocephalus latus]
MNAMLSGISGTPGYLDDIIIMGPSPAELQDRKCLNKQYLNACRNMASACGPTIINCSLHPPGTLDSSLTPVVAIQIPKIFLPSNGCLQPRIYHNFDRFLA